MAWCSVKKRRDDFVFTFTFNVPSRYMPGRTQRGTELYGQNTTHAEAECFLSIPFSLYLPVSTLKSFRLTQKTSCSSALYVQFRPGKWWKFLLFTTSSRPSLGPTQPPILWVSGALFAGLKVPGREAGHSPPSDAKVKIAWSYTSTSPIRLHSMVLN